MKQITVEEYIAYVSDEDFKLVCHCRWRVCRGGKNIYAVASIRGRQVLMHRLIMQAG